MSTKNKVNEKIKKLAEKYSATGQDLPSYLEGLLYADYLSYWNYIHLDTLLSLQTPKTDFPDENIFIIYHQITELYFKLIINELEQITNNGRNIKENGEDLGWKKTLDFDFFKNRMNRVLRYFDNLINSFEIMIQGMNRDEFTKFRMSLLPGSGFQSAQFRSIEIYSTPIENLLIKKPKKNKNKNSDPLKRIYWNQGATELNTEKKTYTLTQFQKKYNDSLNELITNLKDSNLWIKFQKVKATKKEKNELGKLLKQYDFSINIKWKLAHFKSAVKHLKSKNIKKATGGTNWEKYLPPRFQKIIFFPELWSKNEQKEWGVNWLKN